MPSACGVDGVGSGSGVRPGGVGDVAVTGGSLQGSGLASASVSTAALGPMGQGRAALEAGCDPPARPLGTDCVLSHFPLQCRGRCW